MKGRLDIRDKVQVDALCRRLTEMHRIHAANPKTKSVYNYAFEKFSKTRSLPQNRYYWSCVVIPLSEYLGYTPEEMSHILKLKFNPKSVVNRITGEITTIGGSTTELSTVDMETYLERIRVWSITELDFYIALPNETVEI